MRPAARLQAAIELLDEIIDAARSGGSAADKIAQQFFAARRYAGSKDRRAIRELSWSAIRRFGECPSSGRAAFVAMAADDPELNRLFDGSDYGPAAIGVDEPRATGDKLPGWISTHLDSMIDDQEAASLLDRAPLDIRANGLKITRDQALTELEEAVPLDASPNALRLPTGFAIDRHLLMQKGKIEIQDLGSQIISDRCLVRPEMTVLDLCAGAGGKSLALAADMQGQGRLTASDTARSRLDQLRPRAIRAGAADIIETRLLNGGKEIEGLAHLIGNCDVVLVDAPCSGSGTWRRNPETRWRLTPQRLQNVILQQARLLKIGAQMVKPGGAMVYAVCSVITAEGAAQIASFLAANSDWKAEYSDAAIGRACGAGTMLTPNHDSSDGFFFARLVKL